MSVRSDFTLTVMAAGLPVTGVSVVVTRRVGGATVAPFTTETGSTLGSSTLTTNANGKATGNWYPVGDYVVTATKAATDLGAGAGNPVLLNWSPVGGAQTLLNVREAPYGAKGDGRIVSDAAITTGTAQLTSATAVFTAADVGKRVNVVGAGAAAALLSTTIATFTNATTVQLTVNAGTTVSGKICTIATDDSQGFINANTDAHAAGGGVIYVPQVAGFYGMNQLVDVADDVWLRGGGRTGTRLTWMSDLGASAALQSGPNTTNPVGTQPGSNYPIISDLEIVGPGDQNCALGAAPAGMYGVVLRDNGRAKQCNAYGFSAGFVFIGNHQALEDCSAKGNYYGGYWAPTGSTYGDQFIMASEFVGNKKAALGINGENMADSCSFVAVHLGFTPYGIYKENSGAYNKHAVTQTTLVDVAFENIGNAGMFDQGKTGAPAGKDWNNNTFVGGGIWTRDVAYKIAAEASDYMFVANNVFDTKFLPPHGWQPGAVGFFDINSATNVEILDGRSTIAQIVSSALPLFKAANGCQGVYIYNQLGAKCRVLKYVGAAGSATLWDLLYMGTSAGLNACSKQATDIPAGVIQHASADANWVVVAVEGQTLVNVQTTYSSPVYVKMDTGNRGKIIAASTATDAGIIGYSDAGTGSGTGSVILRMR